MNQHGSAVVVVQGHSSVEQPTLNLQALRDMVREKHYSVRSHAVDHMFKEGFSVSSQYVGANPRGRPLGQVQDQPLPRFYVGANPRGRPLGQVQDQPLPRFYVGANPRGRPLGQVQDRPLPRFYVGANPRGRPLGEECRCLILGYPHLSEDTTIPLHVVCDYYDPMWVDIVTAYVPQRPWWITPTQRGRGVRGTAG